MNILLLIMWLVAGVITLIVGDIDRFEYFLVWGMLILKYIESIGWDKRKERIRQHLDELTILVDKCVETANRIEWSEEENND